MSTSPPLLALGAGIVVLGAVGPWGLDARPRSSVAGRSADAPPAVPGWFGRVVASLELPIDPVAAWAAAALAGLVGAAWALVQAPQATLALAALAFGALRAVRSIRRGRRLAGPTDDVLLEVLAAARAALVAGASLTQALGAAAGSGAGAALELGPVLRAVGAGGGVQPALDRWAEERAGTGVGLVVDALAIAGTTGASPALALGAVADTLRDRRARAREVRALASQARASAVVLVVLPAAFAVLVSVSDPAVARFTTGTPAGWACVAGGLLLDAAGAWWMAALIRGVR